MHDRHFRIGLPLVAAALLSACGSSSGPKSTASSMAAAHLDTLAIAASAAGNFNRYRLLTYPIVFLAENGKPASVPLSVDGASQTYQAAVVELVGQTAGPTPVPSDSVFVEVAWTGANVDQLVYAQVLVPDTIADFAVITDTASNVSLDSITALIAGLSTANGKCRTFKLPVDNAAADDFLNGSTCTMWNMTAGFALFFTPNPALPNRAFVLANQTLPGVRIVLAQSNGGQDRIRELRAQLSAQRRARPTTLLSR
jgi:hypothetical protein